jgi:hypothetical protein
VHESGGTDDLRTEDVGHALMSEAHTEHGHDFAEMGNDAAGKASLFGAAGTWRDDDAVRLQVCDLFE